MLTTIWVDVEDLFEYARTNIRPSGIQRLAFEIYAVLHAGDSAERRVFFVRHTSVRNSFRVVSWQSIESIFANLTDQHAPVKSRGAGILPHGMARQTMRKLVQRLPSAVRAQVVTVLLTTTEAARAWARLATGIAKALLSAPGRALQRRGARSSDTESDIDGITLEVDFATTVAPGDVMLVFGSPWFHPDYDGIVRTHKAQYGLRFAMLVYDLIPLRRPEWCDASLVRLFRDWLNPMLPLCDRIFTISKATARDVENYLAETGVRQTLPILPLPLGTGFTTSQVGTGPAVPQPDGGRLPAAGSYALIVSTIEARKNHLLLFRVWRRMLEEMPRDQVPSLVFAGRVGWLVDDLMRQISNTNNLDGKLILVENPTDAELVQLYKGCLFTLCPSFYEGWGLPVTESLALGKPCLISNLTSLPEAGGTLARSFDPDNLHDAYAAIRGVIDDRPGLAAWEAQVKREFKPVPWSATVDALLAGLTFETQAVFQQDKAPSGERLRFGLAHERPGALPPILHGGDPAGA
jgi:glycosyltransferase involved in cell wall biosynthesis